MEKDIVMKENLFFAVEQTRKKEEFVRSYLQRHPEESGIVFCATRRIADTLWKNLSTEGFPAARYHEGMTEKRRLLEMETFAGDRSRVMITTGASGMETEKKNIRFVIHYNMPLSPEDYCREAGYAGRDNETAECIILFSRQDIAIDRMLLRNRRNDGRFTEEEWDSLRRADETRMQKMIAYCTEDHCFRAFLLDYFGEKDKESCGNCSFCLGTATTDAREKEGFLPEGERGKTGPKVRPVDTLEDRQKELFEQLRILRREIASEKKIPPYIVFSDRTLADMCRKIPRTEAELLDVNGVGEYKLEHYGAQFLEILRDFDAA